MMMRRIVAAAALCSLTLGAVGASPALAAVPSATTLQAVAAGPTLTVDQTHLLLTVEAGGAAQATLKVSAPADAPVFVSANSKWLTVTPLLFKGSTDVTVTVNGQGLEPGTVLLSSLTVQTGNAGSLEIPVALTVIKAKETAMFTATPAQLDFGTVPTGQDPLQTVQVTFAQPMTGTITTDAKWLEIMPTTFTNVTSQMVVVKAHPEALTPSQSYQAQLTVSGNVNSLLQVPVTLTVAKAAGDDKGSDQKDKPAFVSPFSDVADDHWAIEAIVKLAEQHIINGIGDGRYAPDLMVTREQFARLLVGALHLPLKPVLAKPSYEDVTLDRWSAAYIETVKPYLTGYRDGLFRPTAPATREDMAVALVLAKGLDQEGLGDPGILPVLFSDADAVSIPLRPYVAIATSKGVMSGFEDGTFRPHDPLTRAQAAVLFYRASKIGGYDKVAP